MLMFAYIYDTGFAGNLLRFVEDHEIRACAAPFSHADVHDGRNSSAGGGLGG